MAVQVNMVHMFPTTKHLLEIKAALIDFVFAAVGQLHRLVANFVYMPAGA